MSFLAPALGLVGLISQYNANQEAEHEAQQQLALQQQMEQEQVGAYNNYMGQVGRLAQQGAFNPAQRLQLLNQNEAYDLGNALNSEAGAARALGYRPGDSVPLAEINQTQGNFQIQDQQLANNILNQANANYLAALQGAPSLSDLGSGINAAGENARMFYGRQQGLGGMLGALSPYLQSLNPYGLARGGSTGAAPTSGYYGAGSTNDYENAQPYGPGQYPAMSSQFNFGGSTNPASMGLGGNYGFANGQPGFGFSIPPLASYGLGASSAPGASSLGSMSSYQLLPGALDPAQQAILNSGGNPNIPAMSVATPARPVQLPQDTRRNTQDSPYGIFGPPPSGPKTQNPTPNAPRQVAQPLIPSPSSQGVGPNGQAQSGAFAGAVQRPSYRLPQPVFNG